MRFQEHYYTNSKQAIGVILTLIEEHFFVARNQLDGICYELNAFLAHLKTDLFIFIELPYVDKVYRDSYYHYFSTKYREHNRDCIRLLFFDARVTPAHLDENKDSRFLNRHFLGYCVLRPTFPFVIGRNLVSKKALRNRNFISCKHSETVLVNGVKLHIEGFPHSSQDQENISCAETTVWAIMEYFGHKYAEYKPVLPSTILNSLNEHSDTRMLPSNGLTVEQISYALKDFGFGPLIYSKENDDYLLEMLSIYIESGFPVIVHLGSSSGIFNHAVVMIGREQIPAKKIVNALKNKKPGAVNFFYSLVEQYVVQDDNHPPYCLIDKHKPGSHYKPGTEYATYTIQSFVVPLYKKMYMDAVKALSIFEKIKTDPDYMPRVGEPLILRIYMASSRSFKEHIGRQTALNIGLREALLSVAMPRFIWCGEYIGPNDAARGTVTSLVVLDATEASEIWSDCFIFAAHKNKTIFHGAIDHAYNQYITKIPFSGFLMYNRNLN